MTSCLKEFELNSATGVVQNILIVDDSRLQRRIMRSLLERWGYSVTEAASAREALEIAARLMPDLVISDWMMPGMTGLDLCQKLRDIQSTAYCYFILVTSKSEKTAIAQGLEDGADDFLTKPVNGAELRARIGAGERILAMQSELREKNQVIGDTLAELRTLYDAIDNDLIEAKKLQESLVKDRSISCGSAQVSLLLRSAGRVGGDLVGYFPAGGNKIGIYGIDVSGHGISSALMTARLAGYLSSAEPDQNIALHRNHLGNIEPRPPADVLAHLNTMVLEDMETEHYFTMILAVFDATTGELCFAQGGHPHPIMQRGKDRFEFLGQGGLPLGLLPHASFENHQIQMTAGDRFYVLSDGISECPNAKGDLLDDAGTERILRSVSKTTGLEKLDLLTWHLADYAGTTDFPDDVSAVLLEYNATTDHSTP
mgnify:CR=1 FL=1